MQGQYFRNFKILNSVVCLMKKDGDVAVYIQNIVKHLRPSHCESS